MSSGWTLAAEEGATRRLAQFVAGLRYDDLPASVVEHAKLCVLDSLGCCLFGVGLPWTRLVIDFVREQGGRPQASVLGTGHRTSASLAALANGTAGHAFELDDVHRGAILHPGSLCFPAALAVAEARGGTPGRELLTAVVAGYEVGARVGMAATQGLFFRGFHPQGTTGVFAAAASAARALGLDVARSQHALGIAGSQAAGLMAAQQGSMVKRFHCGRAAQSGVDGALLAERGFTGTPNVLEAPFGGFLTTLSEHADLPALTRGLGENWETLAVGFKPYAAVASIHSALDGLRGLMRDHGLVAADIAEVVVGVSSMTYTHCAWEYRAQGATAAQMSLYYGLAVMALDGAAFVDQYRDERLADPAILAFIKRIRARVEPEIDGLGPAYRHSARIAVHTCDGRGFDREVLHRRGSPENPLPREEILAKFRRLAAGRLCEDEIDRAEELVDRLETLSDATVLGSLPTRSGADRGS
ncbi:MAG: MmgE/PrpD family protein [Gemmatimonadetes bacterium]|nr:MmgE/PrpD family protein [Gemmatimonadota bacterium]